MKEDDMKLRTSTQILKKKKQFIGCGNGYLKTPGKHNLSKLIKDRREDLKDQVPNPENMAE